MLLRLQSTEGRATSTLECSNRTLRAENVHIRNGSYHRMCYTCHHGDHIPNGMQVNVVLTAHNRKQPRDPSKKQTDCCVNQLICVLAVFRSSNLLLKMSQTGSENCRECFVNVMLFTLTIYLLHYFKIKMVYPTVSCCYCAWNCVSNVEANPAVRSFH